MSGRAAAGAADRPLGRAHGSAPAGGRPTSRGRRVAGAARGCAARPVGAAASAACSGSSFLIGVAGARRARRQHRRRPAGPFGDVARLLGRRDRRRWDPRDRRVGSDVPPRGVLARRARRGRRPRRARRLHDPRHACPRTGPRPMRDLARGFNEMVTRLEADEAQRRTLLADVSHELRTPLRSSRATSRRCSTASTRPTRRISGRSSRRRGSSAGSSTTSGRSPSRRAAACRSTASRRDLAVVATDAVGGLPAGAAGRRRRALASRSRDDVPLLEVDPVRIREVISNLVANALRHTPAGGSVAVDARVGDGRPGGRRHGPGHGLRASSRSCCPTSSTGSRRRAGSRGSGLGLAIARGLVEAHGGSIEVESRPVAGRRSGSGSRVSPEAG